MTIAICVKVHNGVVLAADSASTLHGPQGVLNVYTTARKIFNLYKGLPIGLTTWGIGGIGHASISVLAKDLRKRFMGDGPLHKEYQLDDKNYTMGQVADLTRKFFFEENYLNEFKDTPEGDKPFIGFKLAGYSAGEGLPEVWQIIIDKGNCPPPQLIRPKEEIGINWSGEPEAITRLIKGYSPRLADVLRDDLGVPFEQIAPAMQIIDSKLEAPLLYAPMPIQDAIDLAIYLVEVSIMFSRFMPGAPTVAGPIDVASITKHEGFKWVRRKFWYQAELNL